jgi:ABC-type metal ion transport system substrate-binding protein
MDDRYTIETTHHTDYVAVNFAMHNGKILANRNNKLHIYFNI